MKKLLTVVFLTVFLAGCSEEYHSVPGSNPRQVLVMDYDGRVDNHNIAQACGVGSFAARIQYIANKESALVTCKKGPR